MDKSGIRKRSPRRNSVSTSQKKIPTVVEVIFGLPSEVSKPANPADEGNAQAPKPSGQRLLFRL